MVSFVEPSAALAHDVAYKISEMFSLKQGCYVDLSESNILELMKLNGLDVSSCYLMYMFGSISSEKNNLKIDAVLSYFFDSFVQNASTQTLFGLLNGVLDESIERKNGHVHHVCQSEDAYTLYS